MTRATINARGRAVAEAGMVDTCTISRSTGGETTDPYSGVVTPATSTTLTTKCRFQQRGGQAQQAEAGEAYVLIQQAELQLPISVTGVAVGDVVVCTAAGRDPDLVGRLFRVHDLAHRTDANSRRVQIREITS